MNDHNRSGRSRSAIGYYDGAAATWDATHGAARQNAHFARQIRSSLAALLLSASPGAVALELGAGTGPYVEVAAPLFARLIASDQSAGMLKVFAERIARLAFSNVTLLQADACDLRGIPDSSIDMVYSVGLLETVLDYDRLFAETARVLRPGGMVSGITSNGHCPWYKLRMRLEGGERHGRTGHLATDGELSVVLRRAGFEAPAISYWGAVPPGLQNRALIGLLAAAEAIVVHTPMARHLAVLTFRARKSSQ